MRASDIVAGEYYRLKSQPTYTWLKAIEVLTARSNGNTFPFIVVKCENTIEKGDDLGLIRYYRPRDIIREVSNER